jgi:Immunity protein 21
MVAKVEWIESAGGPLLLAPRSSLNDWLGADGSRRAGSQTDYARVCSIGDEIAVIAIGKRSAVLLGDEPDRTALVAGHSASQVLIVRWRWAESEESLLSGLLAAVAAGTLPFVSAGQLATTAEEYLLFDSACSGAQLDNYLSASLQAGSYLLETAIFKPDSATFALVHCLKPHLRIA